MSPRDKNLRNLNQGKEQVMLLVYPVLPIAPGTNCSRIPELQENVVKNHHA
jgi:hypothetical protein